MYIYIYTLQLHFPIDCLFQDSKIYLIQLNYSTDII